MFKLFFVYLLLLHILGDYYFQTERLSTDKKQSVGKQIKHSVIYLIISIIVVIPIINIHVFYAVIALSISHFIIDIIKYWYLASCLKGNYPAEQERTIYLFDQFLHLTCIFIIAYLMVYKNVNPSISPLVKNSLDIIGISLQILLSWITVFLLIWKPTNITIKQLLCLYKPYGDDESRKTGGFIGLLERLIILILLSINQYSAIGLVLTAKSIARYNRIVENQEFGEYYLLGTLLSTVIVIGSYLVIF